MLAAVLLAVTFLGFVVGAVLTEERGQHDFLAGSVALISALGVFPTLIVAGPLLALFFPNGRLPGPRWRWPVGAIVAAITLSSATIVVRPGPIGDSFADNPLGVAGFAGFESLWATGYALGAAALSFALVLALAAVIVRVRRSGGVERAQLKWFVAANVAVGAFMTLSIMTSTIFDVLAAWSLSLPPIAVGIAILRYRLFEIDRIISRTLSWAIVTGLVVAVFAGVLIVLQAVIAGFIQGQTLAVAGSTLVSFAVFQPVRRRVQMSVDSRFDRARYDAGRTTLAFADRWRDEVDLANLTRDLDTTIRKAIAPRSVSIWLRASRR